MANYILYALKKATITWKNVETNLTPEINKYILDVNNENIKDLKYWDRDIKEQSYIRLFKNQIHPNVKNKIYKLKMPQIINLFSNAPIHILEGIIKDNANSIKTEEIEKKLTNYSTIYNCGYI